MQLYTLNQEKGEKQNGLRADQWIPVVLPLDREENVEVPHFGVCRHAATMHVSIIFLNTQVSVASEFSSQAIK